jgi:hypothetical protein
MEVIERDGSAALLALATTRREEDASIAGGPPM